MWPTLHANTGVDRAFADVRVRRPVRRRCPRLNPAQQQQAAELDPFPTLEEQLCSTPAGRGSDDKHQSRLGSRSSRSGAGLVAPKPSTRARLEPVGRWQATIWMRRPSGLPAGKTFAACESDGRRSPPTRSVRSESRGGSTAQTCFMYVGRAGPAGPTSSKRSDGPRSTRARRPPGTPPDAHADCCVAAAPITIDKAIGKPINGADENGSIAISSTMYPQSSTS